jgi:ABC-2 type transport system permease protein
MNLATLKGFFKKELGQTLRDPRMRVLLFVMPVIQLTMFGFALSNDVRNIKVAVYAKPDDAAATRLRDRLLAGGLFRLAKHPDADPFEAVRSGQADCALVMPSAGLSKARVLGGDVQLLVDASNSVRAQSVENYARNIFQAEMNGGDPAKGKRPGLALSVRLLFNPAMQTAYYMVPGVLGMLLCIVTMSLTAASITREKEMGTFETLLAAPISKGEIILGKTLPYVVLGCLDLPLVLAIAVAMFGVPVRGPLWQFFVGGFLFIGTMVAVGTFVSTVAKNQSQSMMLSFLVLYPAQMLSGIIYPLDNMPWAIKWVAYINPLKYFTTIMRTVTLKGDDPAFFWMNALPMAAICGVTVWAAFNRFQQRLN